MTAGDILVSKNQKKFIRGIRSKAPQSRCIILYIRLSNFDTDPINTDFSNIFLIFLIFDGRSTKKEENN